MKIIVAHTGASGAIYCVKFLKWLTIRRNIKVLFTASEEGFKILEDETDLLSGFRSNLKNVIKESQTNFKSLKELQQDVLNPEIDKINRRFKKIKGLHKLKIGGVVGSFTLDIFRI
ncbi:MAG TPA: hypothetical protein PKW98_04450 [Candidatus Wallbacteria bacterium]|nr:hypothetical protein [Candidatus Wallbacteria bacterium]